MDISLNSGKLCRLCLNVTNVQQESVNETTNQMFTVCLPELDFSICYNYTWCPSCLDYLKESYTFKMKCLRTEEKLRLYMENTIPNELIQLNQIVECVANYENKIFEICRSCLFSTEEFEHIQVDDINGDLILKNMFTACIPEMDFYLSANPVVCTTCICDIKRFYYFKSKCLQTEQEILAEKEAHDNQPINSTVLIESRFKGDSCADESITIEESKHIKQEHPLQIEESNAISTTVQIGSNYQNQFETVDIKEFYSEFDSSEENNFEFINCRSEDANLPIRLHSLSKNAMNPPVDNLKWYVCKTCNYQTHWKSHIDRHQQIHQDNDQTGKTFRCVKCRFTSAYKHLLLKHSTLEHGNWLKCEYCDYQTKWKRCFNQHVLSHKDQVWYSCDQCSYKSKWKNHLKRHMITHE